MDKAPAELATTPRYVAFISYSHQDNSWAEWLHRALESYRVPRRLVGRKTAAGIVPRRLVPIFRDRDELASAPDLTREVNAALENSEYLIVICSPRSAQSAWVNAEVLAFKRLGRSERILCLIIDGTPNASDIPGREAEECFGPALRHEVGADQELTRQRAEPLAADVREGKDGKVNAKLKVIAGMLGVGFDALRQRDLHRRVRRLTVITGLALAVMIVTAALAIRAVILRNEALAARDEAARRRQQAENLVGFMLGDLDKKLAQVQRTDIMEAVADRAVQYVHSLPDSDVTPTALAQLAKALERIGTVRREQGDLRAAAMSYREAAKLSYSLAKGEPANLERQVAYARELSFIGLTEWQQGHLDAAQQSFLEARAVLKGAEARAPDDAQVLNELSSNDNNVGRLFEARGQLDQAAEQYRSMLVHCEALAALKSVEPGWISRLGQAHNNLGRIALMSGNLVTAVAEYAANAAIDADLSGRDPKNNDQRENMLETRAMLGRTRALTGDMKDGIDDLRSAVDNADFLVKVDPNNTQFQDDLALYSSQLSRLERLAGHARDAAALLARSLTIYDSLTGQDPQNADWQQEQAVALLERGTQSLNAGRTNAARTQGELALKMLMPLLAQRPEDRDLILARAGTQLLLAQCTQDVGSANRLRGEAYASLRSVGGAERDPRVLALEVEALLDLSRPEETRALIQQLWAAGYRDASFVALLSRQLIDYPSNAQFEQRLRGAIVQSHRP